MRASADRVARLASKRTALEFSTPEALRTYLQDHPNADKSKHRVERNKDKGPGTEDKPKIKPPPIPEEARKTKPKAKPEVGLSPKPKALEPEAKKAPKPKEKPETKTEPKVEPKAEPKPEAKVEPAVEHEPEVTPETKPSKDPAKDKALTESWSSRLKGLSESATNFVKKAPKALQHFFGNEDFRREAIKEARSAITNGSKKVVERLVESAKHEAHEFKVAARGVKSVMSGKKMSKKERAAFKEVAFHMALAGTSAALAASGPIGGAVVFAESIAKMIAAKAAHRSLAKLHVLEELGHVGHGVAHLLHFIAADGKKKKNNEGAEEEMMAKLVLACVVKELESLSDKDYTEALNSMEDAKDKKASQVVARFLTQT